MKKLLSLVLVLFMSNVILTSCTPLIIGGAVVGGLTIADRRSKGAIADDKIMEASIITQVKTKYPQIIDLNNVNKVSLPSFKVTSYNRKILLVGIVENQQQKEDIENIAKSQKSAEKIYSFLELQGTRNLNEFTNDAWISSKVRMVLMNPSGVSPNDIKIVTYAGNTYVFGLLTAQEQHNAANKISMVPGVKKVITLFETYTPSSNSTKTNQPK